MKTWELFEKANRLWFFEGQTRQAVDLYRQVLHTSPDDPVILFQWARVMWSREQPEDARRALQKAQAHSSLLSSHGAESIKMLEKSIQQSGGFKRKPPIPIEALDVSQLQQKTLSSDDWMRVADAAQERGMYGVALYAFEQGKGSVVSFDEEREHNELIKDAKSALASLHAMRGSN